MIVKMNDEYAKEFFGWVYPFPYEFYNTAKEHYDEAYAEYLSGESDWFAVVNEKGEMIGMYEYSFTTSGLLEIGLGLSPENIGKGKGEDFVLGCISFAYKNYPDYRKEVTLRVWDKNSRAIYLYEKLGFEIYGEVNTESLGKPVTFICMKKDDNKGGV